METESLCEQLGIPKPVRRKIKARDFNHVLGTKAHLLLESEVGPLDSPEWHLNLAPTEGEIRCPNCGNAHRNPALVLCYRVCHHCLFVLREPDEISNEQRHGVQILAASYGHPSDPRLAVDAAAVLQEMVASVQHERLCVLTSDNLERLFGTDPCPRQRKVLRIRYAIDGRRGEVAAFESTGSCHLQKDLYLVRSRTMPLMTILKATYGHPRGVIKGRGAFDVTETLQYRVDSTAGRYCAISRCEDLTEVFGEPAQGRAKQLVIEYEIAGKAGELYEYENGGRLAKAINLDAAPSMAPQIIIEAATYGWTASSLAERKRLVQKQMFDCEMLQSRRSMGLPLSADESKRLRELPAVRATLVTLDDVELAHVDVAEILQRRVEVAGGHILFLGGRKSDVPEWARAELANKESVGIDLKVVDDLNANFGNPAPGRAKLLEIKYYIVGHDADCRTEAPETTSSGFESNFIKQGRGKLVSIIDDDPEGRGTMDTTLILGIPTTLPCIEVAYASYGHPADPSQLRDVTAQVQRVVNTHGGRRIYISAETDLHHLFSEDDPCQGARKKLTIRYVVRGFRGCCRVDESPMNHLRTNVAIGFLSNDADPFKPTARRPYRDESIERNMRLRLPPGRAHLASPYSHLGRGFT